MPLAVDMERLKIAIHHPEPVDHRSRAGDGTRKTVGPAHVGGDELRLPEPAERLQKPRLAGIARSEEHTSELQSLMRISYAVFCLKKKKNKKRRNRRKQ